MVVSITSIAEVQAGHALDVVTRGEKMRGVEARGGGDIFQAGQDFGDFLEARANGDAHPCRVFDEDAQVAEGAWKTLLDGLQLTLATARRAVASPREPG